MDPKGSVYGYIYKLENIVTGKAYIGQTIKEPNKRARNHFYHLRINQHPNHELQKSYNKYGEESFHFRVLDYATSKESLDKLENIYIKNLDGNCYNLREGGIVGWEHSEETKIKMRFAHKDKKLSEEHKKKLSESSKGKKHSIKHRRNVSIAKRGKAKFGFIGSILIKELNPEKKAWKSSIKYNGKVKSLGYYPDPLSANIVYELTWNELFGDAAAEVAK